MQELAGFQQIVGQLTDLRKLVVRRALQKLGGGFGELLRGRFLWRRSECFVNRRS